MLIYGICAWKNKWTEDNNAKDSDKYSPYASLFRMHSCLLDEIQDDSIEKWWKNKKIKPYFFSVGRNFLELWNFEWGDHIIAYFFYRIFMSIIYRAGDSIQTSPIDTPSILMIELICSIGVFEFDISSWISAEWHISWSEEISFLFFIERNNCFIRRFTRIDDGIFRGNDNAFCLRIDEWYPMTGISACIPRCGILDLESLFRWYGVRRIATTDEKTGEKNEYDREGFIHRDWVNYAILFQIFFVSDERVLRSGSEDVCGR